MDKWNKEDCLFLGFLAGGIFGMVLLEVVLFS